MGTVPIAQGAHVDTGVTVEGLGLEDSQTEQESRQLVLFAV